MSNVNTQRAAHFAATARSQRTPEPALSSKCSCGNRKHESHVACSQCWAHVPAPLQQRVWHLYRTARGSDDHRAAVGEAYRAIHAARRAPGAQHRHSEF